MFILNLLPYRSIKVINVSKIHFIINCMCMVVLCALFINQKTVYKGEQIFPMHMHDSKKYNVTSTAITIIVYWQTC